MDMTRVGINIYPSINIPKDIPLTSTQLENMEDRRGNVHYMKRREIENLLHDRELAKQLQEPYDEYS